VSPVPALGSSVELAPLAAVELPCDDDPSLPPLVSAALESDPEGGGAVVGTDANDVVSPCVGWQASPSPKARRSRIRGAMGGSLLLGGREAPAPAPAASPAPSSCSPSRRLSGAAVRRARGPTAAALAHTRINGVASSAVEEFGDEAGDFGGALEVRRQNPVADPGVDLAGGDPERAQVFPA
jgi:hypothetical protein